MRTGNAGFERPNIINANSVFKNGEKLISRPTSSAVPVRNEPWIEEHLQLHTGNSNPKAALREGKLDAELNKIGLAPNKAAYREQIKVSGGRDITLKQPNWFARHFLGKQEKQQPPSAQLIRPCAGKDCKPIPTPPPKPCVAKNCKPTPPPLPPPVHGVCLSGFFNDGVCQPWGYIDGCNRRNDCYAHFASVDSAYCDSILRRLQQEEQNAATLGSQQAACSSGSLITGCANISQDLQITRSRIEQLRRQYQMCRIAAGI